MSLYTRACRWIAATLAIPAIILGSSPATLSYAQEASWPERAITLVVGWTPGGGTDILARNLAEHLSRILGQPVVVDNRPGAGGVVGAKSVAQAEPNGYTLFFASNAELTIAPVVKDLSDFDPVKGLAPVSLISSGPFMIVANMDFPPNGLDELVTYAKENPGKVNYGSFGIGTIGHMLGEQFKQMTGIDTVHVPYQGSAPALVDLVAGRIQYAYTSPMAVMEMVQAGRIKAIAMLASKRLSAADSVPTAVEAGFKDAEGGPQFGLLAPANTPQPIIDRLHDGVVTALGSPEVKEFFEARGHQLIGSSPEEYGEFIRRETNQWQDLASQIGLAKQ